jgi:Flp pilus assembly protein TadB
MGVMTGLLWQFGIPLFVLGPFLAVPGPERPPQPPQPPLTPGQRQLRRRVLIACAALLILVLVPWWARIALAAIVVMVTGLLVTWSRRGTRRWRRGAR